MRLIALEEHMATPEVVEGWRRLDPEWRDLGFERSMAGYVGAALQALDARRLAKMDASGVELDASGYGTHSGRRTKVAVIYRQTGNTSAPPAIWRGAHRP